MKGLIDSLIGGDQEVASDFFRSIGYNVATFSARQVSDVLFVLVGRSESL
jgi:hypothetical protein